MSSLVPKKKDILRTFIEPTYAAVKTSKEHVEGIAPSVPDMPEIDTSPAVDIGLVREASRRQAERLRKRKGYSSTIATGPQGVSGSPSTLKATLG